MKKLLLFVLSTMFFIPALIGQENYQKGYVINLKGDTLRGFINYHNWGTNPRKIDFKAALNGKKTMYKPLNVKSFYVSGESYISAVVKNETSSRTQLNFVGDSATIRTRIDTAFLRIMAGGNPALLFYKNGLNIENYYLMKNGKLHLLGYKKYMAEDTLGYLSTKTYIKENKKYIGQLMVYMQDCPKIRSQISYAEYNRQSLIKLFKNYYKCKHENVTQVAKVEKTKFEFGVMAGMMSNKVDFSFNGSPAPQFNPTTDFTGGVIVDLIMPRNLHEWSIHNEISYSSFDVSSQEPYSYFSGSGQLVSTQNTVKFGYSSVSLIDLARFTYSIGKKVSVFVNAGISDGVILKYTNSSTVSGYAYPPYDLRKRDFAWVAGAGLNYNKIAFEAREDWKGGIAEAYGMGIGISQISFMLEYVF